MKWIKDLVRAEQQMEETNLVDFTAGFDPAAMMEEATYEFLHDLKAAFLEAASAFNELKGSALGNLKIYGVSKTKADFMLFRNGFKLIFAMKCPGCISITYNSLGANFVPATADEGGLDENKQTEYLKSKWGAFGELTWTYRDHEVKLDHLVRFYMSRFVKESAK